MTQWDTQSIALLIGGVTATISLWALFLWASGRQ